MSKTLGGVNKEEKMEGFKKEESFYGEMIVPDGLLTTIIIVLGMVTFFLFILLSIRIDLYIAKISLLLN